MLFFSLQRFYGIIFGIFQFTAIIYLIIFKIYEKEIKDETINV